MKSLFHLAWRLLAVMALSGTLFSPLTLAGVPAVFTDVALPYRIYSSPAPWQADGNLGLAFALVVGKTAGAGTATAVDARLADGRQVAGFPKLSGEVMVVAPGNQVFGGGLNAAPVALDVHGHGRPLAHRHAMAGHSTVGLLAAPALALGNRNGAPAGYLLTGRDYQPHIDSRNALVLLDAGGHPVHGYPVALAGIPEALSPVVDATGERAWVMLFSGQVDGFRLQDGARLPGFPTPVPKSTRPPGGYRLALGPDGASLYVAQGGPSLLRIDGRSAGVAEMALPGAVRLTGLATVGDKLFVLDEGRGRMLQLDGTGRELGGVDIAPAGGSRNVLLWKVALGASDGLLLLSAPDLDQAARIKQLYFERAPQAEQRELAAFMADEARQYGAQALTAEQQGELEDEHLSLKRSWLEKSLGARPLASLLKPSPATRVQVISVSAAGLVTLLDDVVPGYTPNTGFSHSEQVFPALWADAGRTVRLMVPLNAAASRSEPTAYNRSLVRVYTLTSR